MSSSRIPSVDRTRSMDRVGPSVKDLVASRVSKISSGRAKVRVHSAISSRSSKRCLVERAALEEAVNKPRPRVRTSK